MLTLELLDILCKHWKELANNFEYYFPKHEDPQNGNL